MSIILHLVKLCYIQDFPQKPTIKIIYLGDFPKSAMFFLLGNSTQFEVMYSRHNVSLISKTV